MDRFFELISFRVQAASVLAGLFAATSLIAPGAALAQAAGPGLVESPCPAPDPNANARRAEIDARVLTPTPPAEYWRAVEAAQAARAESQRNETADIAAMLARDWPGLCRYKAENAELAGEPQTVVFMGDSITDGWVGGDPDLFSAGTVGRGIGGQTSPQMLVRFWPDVVALQPRVVHIMAGTNDIAGNTGPATIQDFRNNVLAMVALARASDIEVILAAVPPSRSLYWRDNLDPRSSIRALNDWLRTTAREHDVVFVDYGDVLADADGGLREDLGNDGVHPNRAGYAAMRPLADRAIAAALERSEAR
jgi:lysophospholipase L1-like esterase